MGNTRFRRVVLDVVGIGLELVWFARERFQFGIAEDPRGFLHQHRDVDTDRIDRPLDFDRIHDDVRARRGVQYWRCADRFENITQGRYHRRPAIHLHSGYIDISRVNISSVV